MVPCKPRRRLHIHGTHILDSGNGFKDTSVNGIVNFKNKNMLDVLVYNDNSAPIHVFNGTHIAPLTPIVPKTTLYLIDHNGIAHIARMAETVFPVHQKSSKSRQHTKKPTFSRELPAYADVSDEDIIKAQIRYNDKILTEYKKAPQNCFQIS